MDWKTITQLETMINLAAFLVGLGILLGTVFSAVRTFVLPRSSRDRMSDMVYSAVRKGFDFWVRRKGSFRERDRLRAMLAPVSLVALLPTWYLAAAAGYTLMFKASGIETLWEAWVLSGSSLLTLGFAKGETGLQMALTFSASTIGLLLVALLIAYLPTMYTSFAKRERDVNLLAAFAGTPPSAINLLLRYNRLGRLDMLSKLWEAWEVWFAEIEESHTSLTPLILFRSPIPEHSWVTAAGAVLDAAALSLAAVKMPGTPEVKELFQGQSIPDDPQAALCIRMGFVALRRIADTLKIEYHPDPHFPTQPISISRQEFDDAWDELAEAGVPLRTDKELAWQDYAGWRVNYDTTLLALAEFVMAPRAPWSSDREPVEGGLPKRLRPKLGYLSQERQDDE